MLVDSYRQRSHSALFKEPTIEPRPIPSTQSDVAADMPCPQRFAAALQESETTQDGVKMYTWRAVRRQHLRNLRKRTRSIVFFMALIEIMRVGVVDLVYQGKHDTKAPGSEDYGIAHAVGYFLGWIYLCVFAVVWVPFFSWWVPSFSESNPSADPSEPESKPSKAGVFLEKMAQVLTKLNLIILPTCVALDLAQHLYYTVCTFIYVGPRAIDPKDKAANPPLNTRKAWGIRALLFSGICTSLAMGKGVFIILENLDLARVKPIEYLVIVLPIQINLGILMGSAVQIKAEKRQANKLAQRKADAEVALVEEKQSLLVEN